MEAEGMIVYVASKSKHWPFWQALRAAGIDIRSSWVDWIYNHDGTEPPANAWRTHWPRALSRPAKPTSF
jgi:hypothetical protein